MITLSELYIHPLKSAAGIKQETATLDKLGLENDRRWMLVDEKDMFLSQRQMPQMCLIKATAKGNILSLKIPDGSTLDTDCSAGAVRQVTIWGEQCRSIDCGDEVAEWLSDFLKQSCRLVYFPPNEIRQVDMQYARPGDKTGFSDGFPLLLISQASLDDLNSRLAEPVSMNRFRPNLVVAGVEAFAEDSWSKIKIGDITMRVVKPCSRCSIPSVNPATGQRSAEPIKTLRDYRLRDHKVYFGQNVIADNEGVIEVGMNVEILG